ncbi:DUF2875 family protein [Lysobacter sp. FW306-1B-D06B]|uniref:type VI lipase adapter Tla3 domain-containing protein n=1 Tax=Lysobacter sp. FW306-1B-D06B TaxID=3140250 RepID=UPI0031400A59
MIDDGDDKLAWLGERRVEVSAALAAGDTAAANRAADKADTRIGWKTDDTLACLSMEAGDGRALRFFIQRVKRAQPAHVVPRFPCQLKEWAEDIQRPDLLQIAQEEGVIGYDNAVPYDHDSGDRYWPGAARRFDPLTRRYMLHGAPPYLPPEYFHLQDPSNDTDMNETKSTESLQTLDIISVGLSVEVLRQGKVWDAVKSAPDFHSSALPPNDSPLWKFADDFYTTDKREADALELVLRDMIEVWPIPAVLVIDEDAIQFADTPEQKKFYDRVYLSRLCQPAGMAWSAINQLGTVYSDTPEDVVERIFRTFERYPDMPALLVFTRSLARQSNANRKPDGPMETFAAMIVARPERVEWLRPFTRYAWDSDDKKDIYPGWGGWKKLPPQPFKPTAFLPEPWSPKLFAQWDAMHTLAKLHRGVTVKLTDQDDAPLKRKAQDAAMQTGWQQAMGTVAPSRVFFDGGRPGIGMARLAPALAAAQSDLDLVDPKEGIDLASRLGDTGAASPFVMLTLAAMATAETRQPSAVVPLRRKDEASFFLLTPSDSTTAPDFTPKLRPQQAQGPDVPTTFVAPEPPRSYAPPSVFENERRVPGEPSPIDRIIASLPPAPGEDA